MRITLTAILDVPAIKPTVHGDDRGFYFETFTAHEFQLPTGIELPSWRTIGCSSVRNVTRSLRGQIMPLKDKRNRAVGCGIFDVAIDIRCSSPTRGRWLANIRLRTTGSRCASRRDSRTIFRYSRTLMKCFTRRQLRAGAPSGASAEIPDTWSSRRRSAAHRSSPPTMPGVCCTPRPSYCPKNLRSFMVNGEK